jgi:hypothetical protein
MRGASAKLDTSMLDVESWPKNIAVAWVLSRSREFTCACARGGIVFARFDRMSRLVSDERYVVDHEALSWRRSGKPVMLFPSAQVALEQLCKALKVDSSALDFRRSDVVARFPARNESDWRMSVWRGEDPAGSHRIRLAHGAWWLASKGGALPFPLDDRAAWKPALATLLQLIVGRQLPVFAIGPPPARQMPPNIFDEVPVDLPCRASETFGGAPYVPGAISFLSCNLLPPGDRYFERGRTEPAWSDLQIPSKTLQALYQQDDPCGLSTEPRQLNSRTVRAFVANQLATLDNPTLDAVRAAAKGRGNRDLVDAEYREQLKQKTGKPVRQGRRSKNHAAKSAEK